MQNAAREALAKLDALAAFQNVEVLNTTELCRLRDLLHHWHEITRRRSIDEYSGSGH